MPPGEATIGQSSSWAVVFINYLGYGVGRGVFDSVFRSLIASCFPRRLEQMFALTRFGEGASAAIAFGICPCLLGVPINYMLVAMGVVALAGYGIAERLNAGA